MKDILQTILSVFKIKYLSYIVFLLNLTNMIMGLFYIIFQSSIIIWNVYGILILVNLILNFILIFVTKKNIEKATKLCGRINFLCYFYLIITAISPLLILLGNFLISVSYSNSTILNIVFYLMVYSGFFGILTLGTIISYIDIKNLNNREYWKNNEVKKLKNLPSLKRRLLKTGFGIFGLFSLILGSYIAYNLVFVPYSDYTGWWIGIIFYQFSLSLFVILLSSTFIFLLLINRKKYPYYFYSFGIFGLILSSIFLLPLISIPYISFQANQEFTQAFGVDWESKIDPSMERFFQVNPYSITEYFLGNHPKECNIDINIPFYSNKSEGITLHYDAYYPKTSGSLLPGNNSVIINIHGGAWTIGDKGPSNMLQVNKYFAAQGYVVFDIQYGLKEGEFLIIPTPDQVGGNFTINDQLRHIGNFTKYLNTSFFKNRYNLNLNSVFITGNSAGGHLSLASALLIDNGTYTDIFNSALNIKGIIPVYPADPPESIISGSEKFRNPENYFITSNSPPCLMFQGTKDFTLIESK
ncbi:MAG: alpha/beta hydrolase fold domain-containing protein, partial [Candidatus Lokiarchaeota archaeon]|nr:alpha/beta hydrolase fold domain-containing protein [Candidatus Lokiarchaeota archaeon]